MLNLNKKTKIFVLILVTIILSTFVYATSLGYSGCCMDPPCDECYEKYSFCICEFREKIGLEACEECEMHGCGFMDNDLHEMMMDKEVSSCGFH